MTLEFEKLTDEIETMARSAERRELNRLQLVEQALEKLHRHATDWERIDRCLELARHRVDIKRYRAARPLDSLEPLDAAVDPPPLPVLATIVACDGSQITPDRHAAFLYSLVNIGLIVYFHGQEVAPLQFTRPVLDYPGKADEPFADSGAIVNLRRDRAEIEALANAAWSFADAPRPLLALLDQRLLYWPAGGAGENEGNRVLYAWQAAISELRESGALLAGYIDRPRKQSVMTLLDTLDIEEPGFHLDRLTERDMILGLPDGALFSYILEAGQRSRVFVDVSPHNDDFRAYDRLNEVCFFYFNPGPSGRSIARVDIPLAVAQEPEAVAAVHALIVDQCQIIGRYPYVLTRADEIAVVGRQDQQSLNVMIELAMQRAGISGSLTAKQETKDVARAGRTRHEV